MRPLPAAYYEHRKRHPRLTAETAAEAAMTFREPRERTEPVGPRVVERERKAAGTPPRRPLRFAFVPPPCAYLGPEVGKPIKVSCGGGTRKARECYCPDRPVVVGKRSGEPLPILAADNWWCGELGPMKTTTPRSIASCVTCPHRTPQLLLTAQIANPPDRTIDATTAAENPA